MRDSYGRAISRSIATKGIRDENEEDLGGSVERDPFGRRMD